MARKRVARIYTRQRGGVTRYYADLREFGDVLLSDEPVRMALKPQGDPVATSDREIAETLFARKVEELRERKRSKVSTGRWKPSPLAELAADHLEKKAKAGKVTERWLQVVQGQLAEAVRFFGTDRELATIETAEVQRYVQHLAGLPSGRGLSCPQCGASARKPLPGEGLTVTCGADGCEGATWTAGALTPGSQRKYLNSLSNLYRRAASEGYVQPGYNPVAALMDKPTAEQGEAEWLEVPDAALLLEATLRYDPPADKHGTPAELLHAVVATFLLTGGRKSEVLGLTVGDVSFERGKVTFRPHPHRRLKTRTSRRSVPLWPQLREVLVQHVARLQDQSPEALLFPSPRGTGMIRDLRKALDSVAERAGWKAGEIRTKMFRHTYCAARLQTATRVLRTNAEGVDEVHWIPLGRDEVAREMGHGGTSLVARVYGHVGESKHRSDLVEYRADAWKKQLGKRLAALRVA